MSSLSKYEHPYVTVDAVIFRYRNQRLECLLCNRTQAPHEGEWALPGGFMGIESLLEETLLSKVQEKTGVHGYYIEQLKTYDALNRDPRERVISVAYLGLTNDKALPGDWFVVDVQNQLLSKETMTLRFSDLPFDHGTIITDALTRMAGKIWYTDIVKHLMPEKFSISDLAQLFELIEGHPRSNFARTLGSRVEKLDEFLSANETKGRPAALYIWKGVDK